MSDSENNSDDSQPITHVKKKHELYQSDSSISIPLRTLSRWRKRGYIFGDSHEDFAKENYDDSFQGVSGGSSDDENLSELSHESESSDESGNSDERLGGNESESVDKSEDNSTSEDLTNDYSCDDQNYVDEECDEENIELLSKSQMLYENSEMTVDESVFNLLNFYITHNVTKAALQESLNMQLKLLPKYNRMPKSVYQLLQYVQKISPLCRIIKHHYCKKCVCIAESKTIDKKQIFNCSSCKMNNQRQFSCFYEFDISDQIKILFEKYNLLGKLRKPTFENKKYISSLVDGSEYIRVNSRNIRGDFDLTLILNTDGLSLVKSAKSHCWPVLFTIAELPEDTRDNYVIFAGVWYDNENKPPMSVFLKPICLKIRECFFKGIDWINSKTGQSVNTKIVVPLVIADAPARAQLQNVLNFNGRYGCNICEIRTVKSKKIVGKKTVRVYPFTADYRLRVGKRMRAQARKLLQPINKTHLKGVKGHSVLSYLPLIDIGTCLLPEYMHSVLLGVVKQFLSIWFEKKGPWNIKKHIEDIDKLMIGIRPPQTFSRLPRPLSHYKLYKASENYNFLLFYSIPILAPYLPDRHFQHWLLLVKAIFNLVKTTISQQDLDESNNLLELFVSQIEALYSDRDLSYNCHQLRHLVLCVKRWGPLRSISAFSFESYNGFISKCVHGNKNFGQEIVNSIQISQGARMLKNRINNSKKTAEKLNKLNKHELLGNNITNHKFDVDECNLFTSNNLKIENLSIYARLRIDSTVYTSEIYKTVKTNSYMVQIKINESLMYGSIKFFVEFQKDLFIVIRRFSVDHFKMFCHISSRTAIEHIIPITVSNSLMLINLKDIQSMFQLVKVDCYVCKQPNNIKIIW